MYAYTLLTEVYCQSATGVKNVIVFYYIRLMIILFNARYSYLYMVHARFSPLVVDNIMKYMLKWFNLNYLKSLTSQYSIFLSK